MRRKKSFSPREKRALKKRAEEQLDRMRGGRLWRNVDFFLYIVTVVLTALALRTFIIEPIRVDGDSMIPTLHNGELMLVYKGAYWTHEPARGEIVICYYPGYTESCVKRVIGLPGERVAVQEGRILINGAPLDEAHYWDGMIFHDTEETAVGEDEVFVVGDNRNGSKDSRNPTVGCIAYEKVVGRVECVLWPFPALRALGKV